jgi:hypothetical protein
MYFKLCSLALLAFIGGFEVYYDWEWATTLLLLPATLAALVALTGLA